MAITSSIKNTQLLLVQRIFRRPLSLAALISLGLIAWLGLTGYPLMIDQPLPAEKISAHRLRVNNSQLQNLQKTIDAYQTPAAPGIVRVELITAAPIGGTEAE